MHQKGRKKTTESESGTAVGAAHAAVKDRIAKKKNKEVGLDFYRFQKREAHRSGMLIIVINFVQSAYKARAPYILHVLAEIMLGESFMFSPSLFMKRRSKSEDVAISHNYPTN